MRNSCVYDVDTRRIVRGQEVGTGDKRLGVSSIPIIQTSYSRLFNIPISVKYAYIAAKNQVIPSIHSPNSNNRFY